MTRVTVLETGLTPVVDGCSRMLVVQMHWCPIPRGYYLTSKQCLRVVGEVKGRGEMRGVQSEMEVCSAALTLLKQAPHNVIK
jgi:hypothetical protein